MSDMNFPLSESSSKEELANYLCSTFKLADEIKYALINEYISGDIFILLSDDDLKKLGFKISQRFKMRKFIEDNKSKFKEKQIMEKIFINSTKEEVKTFFDKCLEFKGELNSLDGKGLLELTEEKMKLLGLKLGQRRKLIKYIEFFKTLESQKKEEEEILINRNSTEEEVSKFLKSK